MLDFISVKGRYINIEGRYCENKIFLDKRRLIYEGSYYIWK